MRGMGWPLFHPPFHLAFQSPSLAVSVTVHEAEGPDNLIDSDLRVEDLFYPCNNESRLMDRPQSQRFCHSLV